MADREAPARDQDAATDRPRWRQQGWALHAYAVVDGVASEDLKDYRIVVNDLGANVLHGGLAAAVAALEREGGRGRTLLEHLASARLTGLEDATGNDIADRVRRLDVDGYVLASRELLQLAAWLRRAVQATAGIA